MTRSPGADEYVRLLPTRIFPSLSALLRPPTAGPRIRQVVAAFGRSLPGVATPPDGPKHPRHNALRPTRPWPPLPRLATVWPRAATGKPKSRRSNPLRVAKALNQGPGGLIRSRL